MVALGTAAIATIAVGTAVPSAIIAVGIVAHTVQMELLTQSISHYEIIIPIFCVYLAAKN